MTRDDLSRALAPVEFIPGDPEADAPEDGTALCLSGGGYRAMLFHLGSLWRLNEAGYLPRLDRVSSVSGGSIAAGMLGAAWHRLRFDGGGVAQGFDDQVVLPLLHLAGRGIDVEAGLYGLLGPGSIADQLAEHYRRYLLSSERSRTPTLQDLPDRPRFVINATNLESGVLWRFSKAYMADYRVGRVDHPDLDLAVAVAASSAFPPFLSPLTLRVPLGSYAPSSGNQGTDPDLVGPEYRAEVTLTDGGVYDNLGLETAWKRCRTLLVSDAGGQMRTRPHPHHVWPLQMIRVTEVIDNQVRSLRKRQLIEGFVRGVRDGGYWSVRSHPADFPLADPILPPEAEIARAQHVPTRLAALDRFSQEGLVNWGFAACDLALRAHVAPGLARPERLPYPA